LAQEKLDRAAADKTLQDNIDSLEESLINKIQTADALVYKGSVASLSNLPAIGATDNAGNKLAIGWTYKVTQDIKLADATNVTTSSNDDYIRIGDILIANGTETDGAISSNLTWDHIPSGYVADYNPALAADGVTAGAHLTLTKGDDSVDTIVFKVAEGNESLKVSGDVNTIIFSMEWGSFN
jgi:hypothetical protein